MTQPLTCNQTFDTSLVDLKEQPNSNMDADPQLTSSFSTTDTDASDYEQKALATIRAMKARQSVHSEEDTPKAQHSSIFGLETEAGSILPTDIASPVASVAASSLQDGKPKRPIKYLSTLDAYDQWASVYDTDGNILQSVDDLELESMLPEMLGLVTRNPHEQLTILDVGCGTGRNTAKLLSYRWPPNTKVDVTGLEMSSGMLKVAETKLTPLAEKLPHLTLRLVEADAFSQQTPQNAPAADALISTLVLEHIQLTPFFRSLAKLLRPGGYAVVTNMHQEMGLQSQAGFVAADGTKVRGTSWAHGVHDTIKVAEAEGFEIVGSVKETGIDEKMVGTVVGERGAKWIGCRVWYGMILRKRT